MNKPPIVISWGGVTTCGRCGQKLNKSNKTELRLGFCQKCRKESKPILGQLTLMEVPAGEPVASSA